MSVLARNFFARPGDGSDSFHQFTHRLGLGEQPLSDRLGAPLKNLYSRCVVGNRFLWLCRGQERRQKWKDEVPASGHDKELFFRKWRESSGLGAYPSPCELVEGIVTVPLGQGVCVGAVSSPRVRGRDRHAADRVCPDDAGSPRARTWPSSRSTGCQPDANRGGSLLSYSSR
jgi:hypothetical protein